LVDGTVLIGAGGGEVVAYRWFGGRQSSELPGAVPLRGGARTIPRFVETTRRDFPAIGIDVSAVPAGPGGGGPGFGRSIGSGAETARRGSLFARWVWTAGWVIGSAAALWMQAEADDAYDDYRVLGRPDARDRAWDLAARYDRGVLVSWIASEACFALAVRSWLEVAPREGRSP
jgi:hypothetical protein